MGILSSLLSISRITVSLRQRKHKMLIVIFAPTRTIATFEMASQTQPHIILINEDYVTHKAKWTDLLNLFTNTNMQR